MGIADSQLQANILDWAALERFRTYLRQRERSNATVSKYCRDAAGFAAFMAGDPLSREAVIAYKNHLQESSYSVRSINSMLAAVNALLAFMGLESMRVRTLKLQQDIYCPECKELTREEYVRLAFAAGKQGDARLPLLIETICGTGIRVSELPFITVEAARSGEAVVSCKAKTRVVFIVTELRRKLLTYARSHYITGGPIFRGRSGAPLDRTTVWRLLKSACAEANVSPEKVFPHNLRHLFAREFYSVDKDIAKLADVLGHSSIETTRIYIITSGAEHREKMEKLGLVMKDERDEE